MEGNDFPTRTTTASSYDAGISSDFSAYFKDPEVKSSKNFKMDRASAFSLIKYFLIFSSSNLMMTQTGPSSGLTPKNSPSL